MQQQDEARQQFLDSLKKKQQDVERGVQNTMPTHDLRKKEEDMLIAKNMEKNWLGDIYEGKRGENTDKKGREMKEALAQQLREKEERLQKEKDEDKKVAETMRQQVEQSKNREERERQERREKAVRNMRELEDQMREKAHRHNDNMSPVEKTLNKDILSKVNEMETSGNIPTPPAHFL